MQPQASTSPLAGSSLDGELVGDFVSPDQAQLAGDALADELQSIIDEARATDGGEATAIPARAEEPLPGELAKKITPVPPAPNSPTALPLDSEYTFEPPSTITESPAIDLTARVADASANRPENVVPSPALPDSNPVPQAPANHRQGAPGNAPARQPQPAPVDDFDPMQQEASFATPDEVAADAASATAEAELSLDELDRQIRDLTEQTRDLDGIDQCP